MTSDHELINKMLLKMKDPDKEMQAKKQYALHALTVYVQNLCILPATEILKYKIQKDHGIMYQAFLSTLGDDFIVEVLTHFGYSYDGKEQAFVLKAAPKPAEQKIFKEFLKKFKEEKEAQEFDFDCDYKIPFTDTSKESDQLEPEEISYFADPVEDKNVQFQNQNNLDLLKPQESTTAANSEPEYNATPTNSMGLHSINSEWSSNLDDNQPSVASLSEISSTGQQSEPTKSNSSTACPHLNCGGNLEFDICVNCHCCAECPSLSEEICTRCGHDRLTDQWTCYICKEKHSYDNSCDECLTCFQCFIEIRQKVAFCRNCKSRLQNL